MLAPLALVQLALPRFADDARIVNLSSDAAVEAYETWGGYGSSKAALAHLTAILAAENPGLRAYAVDPGDMRTQMQQDAFPGEDISDRPLPEESVPGLLALIEGDLPSGTYRARELAGVSRVSALGLPALVEAHEPPEAHGLARDGVRLLVADQADGTITHARFDDLPRLLSPGDLVVVNTSATLAAALPAIRNDGQKLELRLSTPVEGKDPERFWIVELRCGDAPFGSVEVGERFVLPGGAWAEILAPYAGVRLWLARLELPAAAGRLPRRARQPDPLRLRSAPLAALGVPERLRGRARQRRDAERRPAVHDGADHAARRGRRSRRADRAAHRRLLAGAPRAPVPGALPGARGDGPPRQRRPRLGRPRHRDGNDRRPRARDGRSVLTVSSRPARAGRT